jgi:hypothetical protein
MFKEPGESSPNSVAEKNDRAAASSRSSIRRERTGRDFETRRRYAERSGRRPPDGLSADLLPQTRTRIRNRIRVRQDDGTEQFLERSNLGEPRRWSAATDIVRDRDEEAVENTHRREAGEELLRDILAYHRPGQRMRAPRSPRASALRFEVAPASHSSASPESSADERALLARPYMPSPPYSFSDNSATRRHIAGTDGPLNIVPPEPTPGFAPARGVHRDNEDDREQVMRGSAPRQYTPPGEASWTASYPPLRRVGHLSPRPEPHLSHYGGLGDRPRSLSSSSSEVEQDTWETLLTTMEPDTHLPSADSSFTSATASHSTRQSRHSSQTPTTSFASSTVNPTDRNPSRPPSPTYSYPNPAEAAEMNLEIRSPQYDCLSQMSRSSMRTMLSVIQSSRQFRASNPVAAAVEQRRRADENLVLSNHFNTLRMMDNLRASPEAHRARSPLITDRLEAHLMAMAPPLDGQHRAALDLVSDIGRQSQRVRRSIQDDPAGSQDTSNNPVAEAAENAPRPVLPTSSRRPQPQPDQQQRQRQHRSQDTADTENELDSMQRFVERMARREDIPDEWWAAAGLARTIRENQ